MTAADDTGLVLRAAQFAAMKHRNQRRMDKEATRSLARRCGVVTVDARETNSRFSLRVFT